MKPYIDVNRIEFIVTHRCNSQCKHCEVDQKERKSHPASIDKELAVDIVHKIAQEYSPDSVMTFGGEPLLFSDTVCAIHQAAREEGIPQRQVITNAGWPRSESEFRTVAFKLADSGVNDIVISVDSFHQEHIPIAVVERNVRSLLDAGIEGLKWGPCWVVSKGHDNLWNRRTRSILQSLEHLSVYESGGDVVQPEGNALIWLTEFMPPKKPIPTGSCGDMPYTGRLDKIEEISIKPDGSVEVCNNFAIGNAVKHDIVEMLRNYDPYEIPEMKAILEGGINGLAKLASTKGIETDPDDYYSICDMCISVRRELAKRES